jgi:hypothetical protein
MSDTFGDGIESMLVVCSGGVSISDVCKLKDLVNEGISILYSNLKLRRLTARFQVEHG